VSQTPGDAERKVEDALMRASHLIRTEYGGTVITESPVM
jgi:hypothetical protein